MTPGASCPVPGLSFDPNTPILLAGGATKAIGKIEIGDKVVASDPISGVTTTEPVTALLANLDLDLADVTIIRPDGSSAVVHTTQNHPFTPHRRRGLMPRSCGRVMTSRRRTADWSKSPRCSPGPSQRSCSTSASATYTRTM